MKKYLTVILIALIATFTGCTNTNDKIKDTQTTTDVSKEVNSKDKISEISLNESDLTLINNKLTELTKGSAYEKATFKVKMDDKYKTLLNIGVLIPMNEVMTYFNTTSVDEVVKNIRKSLTFDMIYDSIKSNIDKEFGGMKVYFYFDEDSYNKNDFYTLKSISNK